MQHLLKRHLFHRQNPATLQQLITVFQRELNAAHAREEAAREREALLLQMLQQVQQQNQRLLDMPRSAPSPTTRASPQDALGAPQTHRRTQSPPAPHRGHQEPGVDLRGAMRRRIVAMLHDHPEGLTPAEMRDLLGVDRSLADTCLGMLRYGLVQRVGRGRYVADTVIEAEKSQLRFTKRPHAFQCIVRGLYHARSGFVVHPVVLSRLSLPDTFAKWFCNL